MQRACCRLSCVSVCRSRPVERGPIRSLSNVWCGVGGGGTGRDTLVPHSLAVQHRPLTSTNRGEAPSTTSGELGGLACSVEAPPLPFSRAPQEEEPVVLKDEASRAAASLPRIVPPLRTAAHEGTGTSMGSTRGIMLQVGENLLTTTTTTGRTPTPFSFMGSREVTSSLMEHCSREGHEWCEEAEKREEPPLSGATYTAPLLSPFGDGLYPIPSLHALTSVARMLYKDHTGVGRETPTTTATTTTSAAAGAAGMAQEEEKRRASHPSSKPGSSQEIGVGQDPRQNTLIESASAEPQKTHRHTTPDANRMTEEQERQVLMEKLIVACQRSKEQLALAKSAAQHYKRMEKRGKRALKGQAKALVRAAKELLEEWERVEEEVCGREKDEEGRRKKRDGWWKVRQAEAIRRVVTSSDAGGRGRLAAQPPVLVPFA